MYYVSAVQHFSAAHSLRDYQGKCENLHGHNYKVEVELKGQELTKAGMVVDFTDLRTAMDKVLSRMDHKHLNEIKPFDKINPTAENIAKMIYEEMLLKFSAKKIKVSQVVVWESEGCKATYGPK
ncbi:MAG: 6-carboxytetrahydropterin synthase QueD [Candidatus Edwardsbacteria bacterium]|nr:6-carboxytetrahydropterin synthase QueD [Candidatus Edwardsbacteria bacterium]MBU1576092.1 6-carboxytetrahydropterin synthase QueD [Candidatus Edwardsbacteria bacterium]MBU2462748.1 6-carboxytetrahydropterin synthase QueD [Candidatus Edwardsbacteria bacterium]MBU2593217.1 6-carboxytetrahydropterin synthase QueD [Candidatus Edwardsbacteria bacterium]